MTKKQYAFFVICLASLFILLYVAGLNEMAELNNLYNP